MNGGAGWWMNVIQWVGGHSHSSPQTNRCQLVGEQSGYSIFSGDCGGDSPVMTVGWGGARWVNLAVDGDGAGG